GAVGRSSQSPRFDHSTLRRRRMYRGLASETKSIVKGASLDGVTRSSQGRAGISQKSIIAGIVGSLGLEARCATAIVSFRECGRPPEHELLEYRYSER